jgi:DNA-binding response OmpR family regulator
MSGLTLLRRPRKHSLTKNVPVLVLSAKAHQRRLTSE